MTDRPDPDQPRTGSQRREGRRPRPERGRSTQEDAEQEAPAVTPRALRPDGPSRKPGRALPRIGDNNPPPIDPDDAPSSEAYRFGDARLIPQRGEAADTDDPATEPAEPAEPVDPLETTAAEPSGADPDPDPDDVPEVGWGTSGARMVSPRRDPRPAETEPAVESRPAVPVDTSPSAGSAGTAKALDALSALLARFDDAANDDAVLRDEPAPADVDEPQLPLDTADTVPHAPELPGEPAHAAVDLDTAEIAEIDTVDADTAPVDTDTDTDTADTAAIDTEIAEIAAADAELVAEVAPESVDPEPIEPAIDVALEPQESATDGVDAEPVAEPTGAGDADEEGTDLAAAVIGPDGLTPSQRVARDREVRNRLGPAADDPDLAAAVVATLPPILPAAERQRSAATAPTPPRKLTRWDRPAPPRDWRYVVGMVGRLLIVTGLLMFGFVAYQLWGTGIATARAQNDLASEFEELVAETSGEPVATTAPPVTADTSDTGETDDAGAAPVTTEPSGVTPTPTIAPNAVPQELPEIELGMALARLEIPRMGKTGGDALIVVPGVDPESLQKGPGHYPDTPLPGQLGNAAIAGHRTTWGEPFADIDQLEPGDEIIVTMITGDRFVYEVASTEIVNPEDYYVVTTTDPTVAELTLTSCHPRFSARQRIAVHAFLKAEESDPVGLPTFYDIEANATPIAGDDPTVTVPSSTAPAGTDDTLDDTTAGDTTGADTTDDAASPVPGGPGSGPDALTAGWFHDSAAWPHIAAWGIACAAIAIGAYLLSKRFRNLAIGWSAMALPFVVCLYFVYQNVNRLLPPGL